MRLSLCLMTLGSQHPLLLLVVAEVGLYYSFLVGPRTHRP